MRAHDGLLIVALLLIAAAVGCRKDGSREHASHNTPAAKVVVHNDAPEADVEVGRSVSEPEARADAPTATPVANPPPAESAEGLVEARRELGEIADGALSLRAALLGADFADKKDPNTAPAPPKESTHDSR